jgi:hypothetical protein
MHSDIAQKTRRRENMKSHTTPVFFKDGRQDQKLPLGILVQKMSVLFKGADFR